MPDYFVPLDTAKFTPYHKELAAKGSIPQVALRYLDKNRKALTSKYANVEDFHRSFIVDDECLALLEEQAKMDSVKLKGGQEEYERALPQIKRQLKMYIARDVWDFADFLMIFNKEEDIFLKAYELVKQRNMDKVLLKK